MSDDKPVGTYDANALKYDDRFWAGGTPVIPMTKKEAQLALNDARVKAQAASEKLRIAVDQIERDAAHLHYDRCIREFEEAINEMARFETPGDDD